VSALDELKPSDKRLVMDLLSEAGFDVSDWKNYKGRSPASNPRYCYNWSFEQPGEQIAVCLWHRDLRQEAGRIVYRRKPRVMRLRPDASGAVTWNRRSQEFGENLEIAYLQRLPIRVIIVDGSQRDPAEVKSKASIVRARRLDEVPWAVTELDLATGECLVVRGAAPEAPAVASYDLELSWFEGRQKAAFVLHRRREGRARREKLNQFRNDNGGRLFCEVPKCGFDFVAKYGELGEGYAQVHHLQALGRAPKEGRMVKLEDLAVVCANCHAMIHRGGECRPLEGLMA
jgi:5-methylcytosine-specific restriction enzyme A